MANRVESGGSRWWSCCWCCKDSDTVSPKEREPLVRPISEGGTERSGEQKQGSPQPSYSQYQTRQDVEGSPMK